MNYVSACEAKKLLHINGTTLKVLKDNGIIKHKQFTNKKYTYDVDSVNIDSDESSKQRKHVIYARVSTTKQAQDLNTQIEMIKSYCISNGMNENRKELNVLIDEVISGNIDTVYISFKDRLARFGFDYFKNLFAKFNTKIKILDNFEESNKNFQKELNEDLISIIHHFSMKLYSNSRKKFKDIETILKSEEN